MFNDSISNKPESSNSEEIYEYRRQNCLFWSGFLMGCALRLVDTRSPEIFEQLKNILIRFAGEEFSEFFAKGPFNGMKPDHFFREPDLVWEESLIDDSSIKACVECATEISHVVTNLNEVELFVRWTIPRVEYIRDCNSAEKLIYIAMVIAEELLHIVQRKDVFTWRFIMFSSDVELLGRLSQADRDALQELRELDISYFFLSYFPMSKYGDLQWYEDRSISEDYHKISSATYFIDQLIQLVRKYGDIDVFRELLSQGIGDIEKRDHALSLEISSANSFIDLQEERRN